jgi:hypothetical protein
MGERILELERLLAVEREGRLAAEARVEQLEAGEDVEEVRFCLIVFYSLLFLVLSADQGSEPSCCNALR